MWMFWLGVIFTLVTEALLLNTYLKKKPQGSTLLQPTVQDNSQQAIDTKKTKEGWPDVLVSQIKEYVSKGHQDETCVWLNALLMRHFLELRVSDIFKNKMKNKLKLKLHQKIVSQTNLIKDINIRDLDAGLKPPKIRRAKLSQTDPDHQDLRVEVDFDLIYGGGFSIVIDIELAGGILIPVKVTMGSFLGKLVVAVPRPENWKHFNVNFLNDPGVNFTLDWKLVKGDSEYSFVIEKLNNYLEKKVKQIFVDTWVAPAWRFFELPLLNFPSKHPNCRCDLQGSPSQISYTNFSFNDKFPLDVIVTKDNLDELQSALQLKIEELSKEQGAWYTIKSKNGCTLQKMLGTTEPDVQRGRFSVNFPPKVIFQLLSSPDFMKQIFESLVWSTIVENLDEFSASRRYGFRLEKGEYDLFLLEVGKKIESMLFPTETWIIAKRSIQIPPKDKEVLGETKFLRGFVHFYGFHIQATSENPNISIITAFSQLGQNLSELDLSWKALNNLKSLIEKQAVNSERKDSKDKLKEKENEKEKEKDKDKGESSDKHPEEWEMKPRTSSRVSEYFSARKNSLLYNEAGGISEEAWTEEAQKLAMEKERKTIEEQLNQKNTVKFPEVNAMNCKDIVKETREMFLSYLNNLKEGENSWKRLKEVDKFSIYKRKAEDGSSCEVIKGTIVINMPPQAVFESLMNERYKHLTHPDFLSCELLEDLSCAQINYYRFKHSFLSDRDFVVLEISEKLENSLFPSWVIAQRSLKHPWVGKANKDQIPVRSDVFVSGYMIETLVDKDGDHPEQCRLTHLSQIDGHFPVGVGSHFKYGWARNLEKLKVFIEKTQQGTTELQKKQTLEVGEGFNEAIIKSGQVFAWTVLFDGKEPCHLEWDFDTQWRDIKWGIFFQPSDSKEEEIILPYGRFLSHLHPINGRILILPKQLPKGRFIMRWDNRYSKFTTKQLRYKCSLRYLPNETPISSLLYQHVSGEISISPSEIFKVPFYFSGTLSFDGSFVPSQLTWEFTIDNGNGLSFQILYKPLEDETEEKKKGRNPEDTVVVPAVRFKNQIDTAKGAIPISGKPGRYTFVWDNAGSKWSSRQISYSLGIKAEGEEVSLPIFKREAISIPTSIKTDFSSISLISTSPGSPSTPNSNQLSESPPVKPTIDVLQYEPDIPSTSTS